MRKETGKIVQYLAERSKSIRPNNPKISSWVREYIDLCFENNQPLTILTQWCVSKNLERRLGLADGTFVPTKKEKNVFEVEMPAIVSFIQEQGLTVKWITTFNRSYLDSRRVNLDLEEQYKKMIVDLAVSCTNQGWLRFADWENDILKKRPEPDKNILNSIERIVNPKALEIELKWNAGWAVKEAAMEQTDDQLRRDVYYQIACEAEEGRFMIEDSPFGNFVLAPLEVAEQYDFFTLIAKDLKKRLATVLTPYPWRLG